MIKKVYVCDLCGKELEIKNISDSELNIEGRMDEIKFTGGGT